jgi:hypothetical protein
LKPARTNGELSFISSIPVAPAARASGERAIVAFHSNSLEMSEKYEAWAIGANTETNTENG